VEESSISEWARVGFMAGKVEAEQICEKGGLRNGVAKRCVSDESAG